MAQTGAPGAFGQPAPPPSSWTQRVMAPLGVGAPSPTEQHRDALAAAQAAEAQRLQFDPLALNNGVSAPTPELLVSMADLSCRGGNVDQARQLYQKAVAMEPTHFDALLGAARMEDREGRMDIAIMLYQRAAAAYPNNPTVLNDLGLCLARQGQLPAAERALDRAVQLEPAKPLYRNNLAKVEVELDRIGAACQHLAAVYPPPVVNYNMGVLLYQRGRTAESERFLRTAAAMDPQLTAAHALLAEIRPAAPAYQVARAPVHATPVAHVASPPAASAAPAEKSARPAETPQVVETLTPEAPAIESAPTLLPPVN
jgi:tetratricopeptide (TPR) repeat protein